MTLQEQLDKVFSNYSGDRVLVKTGSENYNKLKSAQAEFYGDFKSKAYEKIGEVSTLENLVSGIKNTVNNFIPETLKREESSEMVFSVKNMSEETFRIRVLILIVGIGIYYFYKGKL